ncbi:hypothetical protein [Longimicrobium terrae]|uniref:Uncharacterized protein n=1 Tax=Longimicrobium terrae TaxID=1639882 RepID=A0A841GXE0_9BACT|nr:hypothetical protein [Longimicrobium terrae]MBB4635692.1 hypothetical protein [Longimicrobium terrae]MBB6070086.1 hypothetical protein [Longimicrobium terrae]NNC32989.1 hypothetical protein [Longimicrobium terrae]
MSHSICAIVLRGPFDAAAAATFDLAGIPLGDDLTLFPITHYYTACWQKTLGVQGDLEGVFPPSLIFPREHVISVLMERITGREPLFSVIATDYFGGVGEQWAQVYRGHAPADPSVTAINPALRLLGVKAKRGLDEFDTAGLDRIRHAPDSLDRYVDLAEELGG